MQTLPIISSFPPWIFTSGPTTTLRGLHEINVLREWMTRHTYVDLRHEDSLLPGLEPSERVKHAAKTFYEHINRVHNDVDPVANVPILSPEIQYRTIVLQTSQRKTKIKCINEKKKPN